MKILIIEDEKALSDSIISYLKYEGHVCEPATNYESALMKINLYNYDCMIIDINLPDGSGLDIIRELKRKNKKGGIIIASARDSVDDRIEGLEIGADDYLTKPFNLSELNARIKSIVRRMNFKGNNTIEFNEIKIDTDSLQTYVNNDLVNLTKKEYDLLIYFLANRNRVLTKESIGEHVWGDYADTLVSLDFIYTHIKNLRKKILKKGSQDYIRNVYGVGYKFST